MVEEQTPEEQKQKKFKKKVTALKTKTKTLLDDFYLGEKTYNKITHKFFNAIKVFIVSSKKFMKDDCLTQASAIAYTTIISLIPTLTVALTFYSMSKVGDKKEIFHKISNLMIEHNIKLNITPILNAISGLIDNAGKIGGVGLIVLIFSATAVLRTLEKSLNDIWQVKKQRPLLLKVIYYWAALTLGPMMLIAGTTVATQISTVFSSPNYKSVYVSQKDSLWTVGNKARIRSYNKSNFKYTQIKRKNIDFYNQRIHQHNKDTNTFKAQEYRLEWMEFKKSNFTDIQFVKNQGWIVGKEGIILRTSNNGKKWFIEKFGNFNFNDILMLNRSSGFIAADNGTILSTSNGGKTWQVKKLPGVESDLNTIAYYKGRIFITGNTGTYISSNNFGNTWDARQIESAKRKDRYANLNHVQFISSDVIWLAASHGMILRTMDGGKTWSSRKFLENNYYCTAFVDKDKGYVGGDKGILIYTEDGGVKWQVKKLPTPRINKIILLKESIWAFGDNGMIMRTLDNGKKWKGTTGTRLIIILLNFFAPFVIIWLLFLMAYIMLPNIKVPFKSASIGAAFTGTVWVVFILLFIVYVKYFATGQMVIYGALAAFPIFLLMIYASAVIILFGAQVSYTLMHPQTYMKLRRISKDNKDVHIYYGLAILFTIYKNFESGKGSTEFKELMKVTHNNEDDISFFSEIFVGHNLIISEDDDTFSPANTSKNILMTDVINMIEEIGMHMPAPATGALRTYMNNLLTNIRESRQSIIGDKTLEELIQEIAEKKDFPKYQPEEKPV